MRYIVYLWVVVINFAAILAPVTASAADNFAPKGLAISPLRQEMTVPANKAGKGSFTIANLTEKPMKVNLSVRQFSVNDYDYQYVFSTPEYDWITLGQTQVDVQSHQSMKIPYTITIPAGTTPGGYYFALFASTDITGPGLPGTVQAASLLYLTVEGKLIRTSVLQNDSIPFIVTGSEIPYKFNVKNTGNIHFTAYFFGQVRSIFNLSPEVGTSHLLMPGAVRAVEESVPSPMLPGVYQVTYGYRVDFAQFVTTKTAYIIFIPPWSVVALILLLVGGRWFWQKKRHSKSVKVS